VGTVRIVYIIFIITCTPCKDNEICVECLQTTSSKSDHARCTQKISETFFRVSYLL